jgi:hypothetical protein
MHFVMTDVVTTPVDPKPATAAELWRKLVNNEIPLVSLTDGQLGFLERNLDPEHEARYSVETGNPDSITQLEHLRQLRDKAVAESESASLANEEDAGSSGEEDDFEFVAVPQKAEMVEIVIFKLDGPPSSQPVFTWVRPPRGMAHLCRMAGASFGRVIAQKIEQHARAEERDLRGIEAYSQAALITLWKWADRRRGEIRRRRRS